MDYVPIKAPPLTKIIPTPPTENFEPDVQRHTPPPVETSNLPEEFQYQWEDSSIPPTNEQTQASPPPPDVVDSTIVVEPPIVTCTGRTIQPTMVNFRITLVLVLIDGLMDLSL